MIFFFETVSGAERYSPEDYIKFHSFLHQYNPKVKIIAKAVKWKECPQILLEAISVEDLISLVRESECPIIIKNQEGDYYPTITLYDDNEYWE